MKIANKRVLITGAGGFIGSHLADRLASENEVVIVDDFSIGSRANLAQLTDLTNVRIIEADITDRTRMKEVMSGIDIAFHMAISCLRTSLNRPEMSHSINAGGTLSVALAALDSEIDRFVYVSSSEVYGSAVAVPMTESHPFRPTTVYGASKLAGEMYSLALWRTAGLPVLVVRPFNTYGPREPWKGARAEVIPRFILRLIEEERPVIYGDGSQTRDFTHVDDTVRGLIGAAECDELIGDAVNIAYGQEVSIAWIANKLAELMGRSELRPKHVDSRPADVHRHFASIDKAQRLFSYSPRVDITSGLQRTVSWFERKIRQRRIRSARAGEQNW